MDAEYPILLRRRGIRFDRRRMAKATIVHLVTEASDTAPGSAAFGTVCGRRLYVSEYVTIRDRDDMARFGVGHTHLKPCALCFRSREPADAAAEAQLARERAEVAEREEETQLRLMRRDAEATKIQRDREQETWDAIGDWLEAGLEQDLADAIEAGLLVVAEPG